jgi:hypothetical protein
VALSESNAKDIETVELDHGEAVPPEAEGAIALLAFALAVLLLLVAPFATRAQPPDKAWFLAPINAPVLALLVMGVPAAFMSWRWLQAYRHSQNQRLYLLRSRWAFADLPGAIEHIIYFCGYLWAISYLGFAVSTLLFGQLCLWRSGLSGWRWALANLVFAAGLVVLLRGVLGLWFPMAPLFKLLPPSLGNALGAFL